MSNFNELNKSSIISLSAHDINIILNYIGHIVTVNAFKSDFASLVIIKIAFDYVFEFLL